MLPLLSNADENVVVPTIETLGMPGAPAFSSRPAVDTNIPEVLTRRLSDIRPTLDYAWGDVTKENLPADFHESISDGPYTETFGSNKVLHWSPTNLWYYPLYYEDPSLERYGHTRRPVTQSLVSVGRFLGQTVTLPYQASIHSPCCPVYALGYYQPGECAPKLRRAAPWNNEAAAHEALCVLGLILLIP